MHIYIFFQCLELLEIVKEIKHETLPNSFVDCQVTGFFFILESVNP